MTRRPDRDRPRRRDEMPASKPMSRMPAAGLLGTRSPTATPVSASRPNTSPRCSSRSAGSPPTGPTTVEAPAWTYPSPVRSPPRIAAPSGPAPARVRPDRGDRPAVGALPRRPLTRTQSSQRIPARRESHAEQENLRTQKTPAALLGRRKESALWALSWDVPPHYP